MCVCVYVYDQSSEELYLSVNHFKQIISFLRDFIHSQELKVMASMISKLEVDLEFDSPSLGQIQLVLFGFHNAVSTISGPKNMPEGRKLTEAARSKPMEFNYHLLSQSPSLLTCLLLNPGFSSSF